jgi:hypothetical protein
MAFVLVCSGQMMTTSAAEKIAACWDRRTTTTDMNASEEVTCGVACVFGVSSFQCRNTTYFSRDGNSSLTQANSIALLLL